MEYGPRGGALLDRRNFLQGIASLAGAWTLESSVFARLGVPRPPLPDAALLHANEEAYWKELRRQFVIPEDVVHLNTATVGSCPLPVLEAVFQGYRETEKLTDTDPEVYPVWGYEEDCCDEFRDPLAALLGSSRDELALIHNATEGCNFIANGVEMKAGDEVIITDQEHQAGKQPWYDPGMRCGIVAVNVPGIKRMELETWLWKQHKIRIRGGEPSRLRLATAYFVQKGDIDRSLDKFDQYRKTMA